MPKDLSSMSQICFAPWPQICKLCSQNSTRLPHDRFGVFSFHISFGLQSLGKLEKTLQVSELGQAGLHHVIIKASRLYY